MKHFQTRFVVWCCNGWCLVVLGQYGAVVAVLASGDFILSHLYLLLPILALWHWGAKLCEGNKEASGIRFSHPIVETLQPTPSICPPYALPPKAKPHSARLPSIHGSVGGRPPPSKHLLRVLISHLSRVLKVCCSIWNIFRGYRFNLPSNTEKLPLNWKGSNENEKRGQTTNKLGATFEKISFQGRFECTKRSWIYIYSSPQFLLGNTQK